MSKELRQFSIFDGCTANPNLVQTKGRPIAYAENVKVIELTPEVQRKLELFDEAVEALRFYGNITNWTSYDNQVFKSITQTDLSQESFYEVESIEHIDLYGGKQARQFLKKLGE